MWNFGRSWPSPRINTIPSLSVPLFRITLSPSAVLSSQEPQDTGVRFGDPILKMPAEGELTVWEVLPVGEELPSSGMAGIQH
ncbi:hypothetical protein SKAU_G00170190 [Synaphobranchus kaupii]|uniref:Uncharacterized protein n=1 Tax=Synaphobranchus kaupii TaxID=118154 RepID=A0A9Q1IYI1_SYNKA|nr:hypothetical protein SKAU_G00170190 [Synaphobranchus kaupii]